MNLKELVTGAAGEKQFLLGNEAAVRGLIEAGISVISEVLRQLRISIWQFWSSVN